MKNLKSIVAVTIVSATLFSCADEKKNDAQKAVDSYTAYVDSISNAASDSMSENWSDIESAYTARKIEAESALENLEDRAEYDSKVESASMRYEEFKAKLAADRQKMEAENAKLKLRNSLFVGREIGTEMDFGWVNKDNILNTFETFVNTVSDNKDKYTREDWDEIKMLYEALGTRKNTVEKEGLTSSDNMKIAGLKVKFAPMYKLNRMGAKAEENAEAKE